LKKAALDGAGSPEPLDLRAILQFFAGLVDLKNCSGPISRAQGSASLAFAQPE